MNLEHNGNLRPIKQDEVAFETLQHLLLTLEQRYQRLEQQVAEVQQSNIDYARQNRFQASLLDQVCNAIIATDLQGNIIHWNHYAEALYQWTAAEVVGKSIISVLAPANGQRVIRQIVIQGFKADLWEGEVLLHRKDGSQVWVEGKNTLLKGQDDTPQGFIGISFDVTERKQAQMALLHQAAQLRSHAALLDLTHDSILVFDLNGILTFWNQGAERTYGWRQAEVLGHNVHHLLNTTSDRPLKTITRELLLRDRWEGELIHTRRDGSQVVVASRQVLRRDEAGKPLEILEINNDITARQQIAIALQQAHDDLELRVQERTQELAQSNQALQAEIGEREQAEVALRQSEEALARRERFLTTLVEIQTWLLTHTHEDCFYKHVLKSLGRVVGADRVYVFENHPGVTGGKVLTSQRAEWCATGIEPEIDNPVLQNFCYADHGLEWMTNLQRGEVINRTSAEYSDQERLVLEPQGILAILLFPLRVNHALWGFIGFDNCHESRLWDALEVNVLGSAASSIAMALERHLAEQRVQQQANRDRLLGAIALRIRASLDLEEILQRTVAEIRQFLQTDRVLIYRFDGQHGILVAASVLPQWSIVGEESAHQIWYRDESAVYERGQTSVVYDVEQQGFPSDYLQFMRQLQVQAKLVVPIVQNSQPNTDGQCNSTIELTTHDLQDGDYLWGVLAVHQCHSIRRWQPFEIDLVQKLAVQVAIAIQQAQLFSQLQQQAQREQLLNQLSQALNSSLDPNHILQEIVNRTGESFAVDRAVIFILGDEIRAINEWRLNIKVPSMLGFQVPVAEWPDLLNPNSDFNQGQAFYCLDLSLEATTPARRFQAFDLQCRSVLSVPIMIGDRLFGALSLMTTTCYRTFGDEEVQFLHRIASHAAIALYNAQSYSYLEQLVKQRTQELEQEKLISETANRAKSEFLATMSHELRTPLNAILGLSQILQREIFGNLSAKQLEYINHIHSSGDHLLMLINDILDLAKVESGRESLHLAHLPIQEICSSCLALVQEQASSQGLQLYSQIDSTLETCYADERRLKQMLLNLLSNAVKFTSAGSVTLIVEQQPDWMTFAVQDTGIGIAADKISLLFQPFSQLDSQLSRHYAGTGLGLALTRKLARLHGGEITVESIPNQGSTFTLYLPKTSNVVSPIDGAFTNEIFPACPYPQTTYGHKRRVLILEDDALSAVLLQDYLKASGYQVLRLADGTKFLQTLRKYRPDLILMDVQLTNATTGLDLLQQLRDRAEFQTLPVVMVTAMAMAGDREKFLNAGATAYLSKPLDIMQLELVLMNYLE